MTDSCLVFQTGSHCLSLGSLESTKIPLLLSLKWLLFFFFCLCLCFPPQGLANLEHVILSHFLSAGLRGLCH